MNAKDALCVGNNVREYGAETIYGRVNGNSYYAAVTDDWTFAVTLYAGGTIIGSVGTVNSLPWLSCIGSTIACGHSDGAITVLSVTNSAYSASGDWSASNGIYRFVSYDAAVTAFPAAPLSHRPMTFGRR